MGVFACAPPHKRVVLLEELLAGEIRNQISPYPEILDPGGPRPRDELSEQCPGREGTWL